MLKGYKCPKCGKVHSSEEWNSKTLELCTNRALRRKYVPIEKAGDRNWYKCPECGSQNRRKDITVVEETAAQLNQI